MATPGLKKIVPFLWFNNNAEEAINYYMSLFKNSKIVNMSRIGDGTPGQKGMVMMATFELEGQLFYALNGGPMFPHTEAFSIFVNCETQDEVDTLWEKLSDGGKKSRCGWVQDKFGLWWQVIPTVLGELMGDKDPVKSQRVMAAMMTMDKIDIAGLRKAYAGS